MPIYLPCAPDNLSNDRFFNAWQGPAWQIHAGNNDQLNHVCV